MNGYTNRETWATVLHISNNETLYYCINPLKFDYFGPALVFQIRDTLYQYFNKGELVEMLEDIGDISKVNWREVAEAVNHD